jgi:hypothetical protein
MSEQNKEDQLNAIKDKAGEQYNFQELHINRVPDQAVGKLQDLAYEMFAGDYGAALAYLLELHEVREEFDSKLVATNQKVVEMDERLGNLEAVLKQQEKNDNDSSSAKKDTLQ